MIFDLKNGLFTSEKSSFSVNLTGNFNSIYTLDFQNQIAEKPVLTNELFLLPLSVQFRPLPDGSLWLDWAESEKGSEYWSERFTLSILDRSFQAANELCRRTNEFEIQLSLNPAVHPEWERVLTERFTSAFSIEFI